MVDDLRIAAALAVLGADHRHRRQERDADGALTLEASRQHDRLTGDVDRFVFDSMLYSSVSFGNFAMETRPCSSMTDEAGGSRCPAESPMEPNVARGGAKASNVDDRHRQPSASTGVMDVRPELAQRTPHRSGRVVWWRHFGSFALQIGKICSTKLPIFLERWSGSISGVEARSYRPRNGMIPRPRTSAIAATLALEDRLPDLVRVGIGNGFIKDAGPIPAVVSCDTFLVGNQ